jgi:dihydrofolate reductase/thymidylate synthase
MSGFNIIVAATNSMGIGRNGTLPWKIKADMDYFKRLTTSTNFTTRKNAVIMGRITYESIPEKFRPLQDRINVVITRNSDLKNLLNIPENVILASSFEDALNILDSPTMGVNEIFVIGGASIYRESIQSSRCKKIYLTLIYSEVNDVDAMFPIIPAHIYTLSSQSELFEENGYSFRFTEYERIDEKSNVSKHEEYQYLGIVKDIIESGSIRGDRTGTGTLSKFGVQMRFSLRQNSFPLLTTKKVFWRGVVEELLWFIQGCTNAKELANRGVHIWDGNGSREYLDRIGFTEREEGDLGPIYGFQVYYYVIRTHLTA